MTDREPDQKPNIKNQNLDQKPKMDTKYRAFYLSIDIIKFVDKLDYKISTKVISEQLVKSVTSVGANMVEARGSSSKREFLKFFEIALKSSQETKYWLAMLKELLPEKKERLDNFIKEALEITKVLSSSVLTMKGKKKL